MNLSVLGNPQVWTAATAVTALIVSLWLKLRAFVSSPSINITLPGSFSLQHYLGNITLTIFLDLRNDGPKSVDVSKIDCYIVKNA